MLDERRAQIHAFGSPEKTAEMSHCKQRATESFAGDEGGTHGTTVGEHLFLSLEERLTVFSFGRIFTTAGGFDPGKCRARLGSSAYLVQRMMMKMYLRTDQRQILP